MGTRRIEPYTKHTDEGSPLGEDEYSHPAAAQLTIHRGSYAGGAGAGTYLYGSDMKHRNTVTVTLHESTLKRNLSSDWHHAGKTLFEIEMSESQWAAFVASFNVGSGVPVTLRRKPGDWDIPGLPETDKREHFEDEMIETFEDAVKHLKAAHGLSKTVAARRAIERAIQELEKNVPYVREQFDRYMEDAASKLRHEAHAYLTNMVREAGIRALYGPGGQDAPGIEDQRGRSEDDESEQD